MPRSVCPGNPLTQFYNIGFGNHLMAYKKKKTKKKTKTKNKHENNQNVQSQCSKKHSFLLLLFHLLQLLLYHVANIYEQEIITTASQSVRHTQTQTHTFFPRSKLLSCWEILEKLVYDCLTDRPTGRQAAWRTYCQN